MTPNTSLQRTRWPLPLSRKPLGDTRKLLPVVLLLAGLVVTGCRSRGMQNGVAPGLSSEMMVYRGAVRPRSSLHAGLERLTYDVDVAYPAQDVINSISRRLADRGYRPLRNNWYNRGDASEYVRGWVQSTVVNKPGGKERYLCRWWAQWRNAQGDVVDYALTFLSPGEAFTNNSHLEVSATKMNESVAERLTPADARPRQVIELSSNTPPNAETASDNSPDPHTFQVRPDSDTSGEDDRRTKGSLPRLGVRALPAGIASAQQPSEVMLQEATDLHGTSYTFSISREAAERVPDWQPDRPGPPLSIARAVSLAKRAAQRQRPKFSEFKVSSISLQGMNCSPVIPDKWFYVIHLDPVVDGQPMAGEGFWEVVLTDGMVVPPKVKSER
jgi:hypothetical protein